MLAVNSFPLDRVARIIPAMRDLRLTDPAYVSRADIAEITRQLFAVGYARGILVGMFAERLQSLMQKIADGGLDDLARLVERRDRSAIAEQLRAGPKIPTFVTVVAPQLLAAASRQPGGQEAFKEAAA